VYNASSMGLHGIGTKRMLSGLMTTTVRIGLHSEKPRIKRMPVSIDSKESMLIDQQCEIAKRLWDEGFLHVEIAKQMGCMRLLCP
jgi:hypothetical protein